MDSELWDKVQDVFAEIIELEPGDRAQALDRLCNGNQTLREEVESLLFHHDRSDDFMASSAVEEYGALIPKEDENAFPSIKGPYRIKSLLGRGGMGSVYQADSTDDIERVVALKVMNFGIDHVEFATRFRYERQALALLNHPNVAHIYDHGLTEDKRPYFTMEFVDGEAITDYIQSHNLSMKQRLDLFLRVCDGVQHMHRKGIIHRDLKPSNVLVEETPDGPVPKIIDFGIAKVTTKNQPEMTGAGSFLGTPAFMSPEQARGLDMDTSTDVYALGVLLYQMLTDLQPFDEEVFRNPDLEERLILIQYVEPPKPSERLNKWLEQSDDEYALTLDETRDYTGRVKRLRGELDLIISKAISKDRELRYSSVADFSGDLLRYLSNQPVLAKPPSPWYIASKYFRRHRTGVLTGLFFAMAMIAAIIALAVLYNQVLDANREKEKSLEMAEAGFEMILDMLGNSFQPVDGDVDRSIELIRAAAKDQGYSENAPAYQVTIDFVIGHSLLWWGYYTDAEQYLRDARKEIESLGMEDEDLYFQASIKLVEALRRQGQYDKARLVAENTLTAIGERFGQKHPRFLEAKMQRLQIDVTEGGFKNDTEMLKRVEPEIDQLVSAIGAVLGEDHQYTLLVRNSRILLRATKLGEHSDAWLAAFSEMIPEYRVLAADIEAAMGSSHPHYHVTRRDLARALWLRGEHSEAEILAKESYESLSVLRGDTHLETLIAQNIYFLILRSQGKVRAAFELVEPLGGEITLERTGQTPIPYFDALNNKADALNLLGRYEESITLKYEELRQRCRSDFFKDDQVLLSRVTLGESLFGLNRYEEAGRHFESYLAYQVKQDNSFLVKEVLWLLLETSKALGKSDRLKDLEAWQGDINNGLVAKSQFVPNWITPQLSSEPCGQY